MSSKSKNAGKFPNSRAVAVLKPKGGLLVDVMTNDITKASGRELGAIAQLARVKTAHSLLEFSACVYQAYSRYYEPWKKVGRKGAARVREAREADAHWNDFLTEIGWQDFSRYQKTIRQHVEIGRRAAVLQSHSAELPGTVSALSAMCKAINTDRQLEKIAKLCSPETTAAEVKKLIKQSAPPSAQAAEEYEEYEDDESIGTFTFNLILRPIDLEANAAVLATLIALEMTEDVLGSTLPLPVLHEIDPDLHDAVRAYLESSAFKALVKLYDQRVESSDVVKAAWDEKKKQDDEVVRVVRETMGGHGKSDTKKRDFSKLKV